tara:strand:+ start:4040 stop:5929 length:1890 start_codon:yes stop_codon:yes gene_type:complete
MGWVKNLLRRTEGHLDFFNGTFLESFDAKVTSDGATITMTLEKSGGGDLTMNFSDGQTTLDCTPAASIALTPGTDTIPVTNYVYILQSTRALTVSTSDWPATVEHIKVSHVLSPSASLVNTGSAGNNFVYVNQNWNDHMMDTNNQGHLLHIVERSRRFGAIWHSGTEGVATQDGNDLWVSVSAGVIFQMHRHSFAALDSDTAGAGDPILVINDPDAAYAQINSLNEITKDAAGVLLGNNKWIKVVLWLVANKGGEVSPMMANLPTGTYNSQSDAEIDVDGLAVFDVPHEFATDSTTGLLCAAFVCQHTALAMLLGSTTDLRGQIPGMVAGGGTGGGDVTAAAVLTDNAVVRGDGGAKGVQTSTVLVDDNSNVSGVGTLGVSGAITSILGIGAPIVVTSSEMCASLNVEFLGGVAVAALLRVDGSLPLTANWDAGAFTFTGTQFISDIAIGTAPLVVTSTTEVANLHAERAMGIFTGVAAPGSPVIGDKYIDSVDEMEYKYDATRAHWFGPLEFSDFGRNAAISGGENLRSTIDGMTPIGTRGFMVPYNCTVVAMVCRVASGATFTGSFEIYYGATASGVTVVFTAAAEAQDLTLDYDLGTAEALGVRVNITSGTPTNATVRVYYRRRKS